MLSRRIMLTASTAQLALLAACATSAATTRRDAPGPDVPAPVPPPTAGNQLSMLLDRTSTAILHQSPERCTGLGVSEQRAGGRYIDKLDDHSKAANAANKALLQQTLTDLGNINREQLNHTDQVTYDVVAAQMQNQLGAAQFPFGGGAGGPLVVTQLTGAYQSTPDFLDNRHPLQTREHVDAYMSRLAAYATQLNQDTEVLNADVAAGVIAPDFNLDGALHQLGQFAALKPEDTVLVKTLVRRLPNVSDVPEGERAQIIAHATQIVNDQIMPAYHRQIDAVHAARAHATHDAGIWRLPNGEAMYAAALKSRTTVSMTPAEIHQMGLGILEDTHGQMDAILKRHGLTRGSIAVRMQQLSRRRDQLYPNTDAGRAQILADLNARIRDIVTRMPRVCGVLAHAPLDIRRVPVTTEAGAPGGYYQRGSIDGTRPGAYYINLRDTAEWPKFALPTLNYHEGIPGHHWQISISQETGGLPFIRSALLGNSAFSEGWGLYAEQLAGELGVYDDDELGRLGYLQSMAFRASRLVVDTGIHAMHWTREQAIQSMAEADGEKVSAVTTEVERYCVQPGQACAYMIGKTKIVELRENARTQLGDKFDIKGFHDAVLTNGAVPLTVLEQIVADWAQSRRA